MPCTAEEYASVAMSQGYENRNTLNELIRRIDYLEDVVRNLLTLVNDLSGQIHPNETVVVNYE